MAGFNLGDIFTTLKYKSEGVKEVVSEAKHVSEQIKDNAQKASNFGDKVSDAGKKAAIAFTAAGAGLTLFAKSATDFTVDYVKESKTLSRLIGENVQDTSRLVYAFSRMGMSVQDVSGSLGIFSKNIANATKGAAANSAEVASLNNQIEATKFEIEQTNKEIKKNGDSSGELGIKLRGLEADLDGLEVKLKDTGSAFDKLGVSTTDAEGKQKDFQTLLLEVADKFKEMPDGIDKTALSMELFGRSGKDMIKVLNLGSEGIKDLEKRADELGLTLNENTIGRINELIQSQKDLKETQDALKIAIGTETAPVLAQFNQMWVDLLNMLLQNDGALKTITVSFLAFGGPVFGAIGAVAAFVANMSDAIKAVKALNLSMISFMGFAALAASAAIAAALVVKAVETIIGAWKAADNAIRAATVAQTAQNEAINTINKQIAAGKLSRAQGAKLIAQMSTPGQSGRQHGGMVFAGQEYMVGERGVPEVFRPQGSGQIIPMNKMKSGPTEINKTVNINGPINVGGTNDANYLLGRIDRNLQLENMGVSSAHG